MMAVVFAEKEAMLEKNWSFTQKVGHRQPQYYTPVNWSFAKTFSSLEPVLLAGNDRNILLVSKSEYSIDIHANMSIFF